MKHLLLSLLITVALLLGGRTTSMAADFNYNVNVIV